MESLVACYFLKLTFSGNDTTAPSSVLLVFLFGRESGFPLRSRQSLPRIFHLLYRLPITCLYLSWLHHKSVSLRCLYLSWLLVITLGIHILCFRIVPITLIKIPCPHHAHQNTPCPHYAHQNTLSPWLIHICDFSPIPLKIPDLSVPELSSSA